MRPTLRQVFGFSLLALVLGLALLFYLVFDGSQKTSLQSSERYRDLASQEVAHLVTTYLNEAPMAVHDFELQVKYGLIAPKNPASVEQALLALLLANEDISEATLTYANGKGDGPDGYLLIDRASAGQVTVLRAADGGYVRKRTWFNGTQFVSQSQPVTLGSSNKMMPMTPVVISLDPTAHPTFQAAASNNHYDPSSDNELIKHGQIISTDLHWSQIDETLPESQRRVEVSMQKAIEDQQGRFAGVLRVGLMKTQIDHAVQQHITPKGEDDPHLIFLCDNEGRLVTGFGKQDHVVVSGDDLRIPTDQAPPVVVQALREPVLKSVDQDHFLAATSFQMGNQVYLCTFRYLPGTQDWIVGIVVPRDYYLGTLIEIRRHVLLALIALIAVIVLGGWLIIRSVVKSQALILRETTKMNEFEFASTCHPRSLRDIEEILAGFERAKTAMRAMSKYVPVNLVRQLYRKGEEPTLGGQAHELSVLFTDIQDFTSSAESLPPDRLAEILGRYLQVMAEAIQSRQGTVDKYIGDAVMAFWNAPEAVANHEVLACQAALDCRDALQKLYDSPAWGDSPRFETRFGLHRCTALVGHFGAPDRLNYTAIGDGINLASRLEGLNKYYGTHLIASECIHATTGDAFLFRLLDCVAVKGKTEDITIYELIARRKPGSVRPERFDRYEEAFALYQKGDFHAALRLFEQQAVEDYPSRVMADRCREFLLHAPADWSGVHIFASK